ncbi:hypothetical protein GQR58_005355 [Nymphon striatum]|nr:hypothetical protein GQR58_005355 [Nymphon striatum]
MGKADRCAIVGCPNDRRHPEKYIIKDHIRSEEPPFIRFWTCKSSFYDIWTKLLDRKLSTTTSGPTPHESTFQVGKYTKVCSNHFKHGRPTRWDPHPTLYLKGYGVLVGELTKRNIEGLMNSTNDNQTAQFSVSHAPESRDNVFGRIPNNQQVGMTTCIPHSVQTLERTMIIPHFLGSYGGCKVPEIKVINTTIITLHEKPNAISEDPVHPQKLWETATKDSNMEPCEPKSQI